MNNRFLRKKCRSVIEQIKIQGEKGKDFHYYRYNTKIDN